jgi:hypothetical protein
MIVVASQAVAYVLALNERPDLDMLPGKLHLILRKYTSAH